jgi:hypothetical protein
MTPQPGIFFIRPMGMPNFIDAYPFLQIWANICTQGVAESILQKVQAAGVINTSMSLQPQPFEVLSLEPDLGFWVINGITFDGVAVSEYAGSLAARETQPNPFVDGKGGPYLKIQKFSGIAQLYWGT